MKRTFLNIFVILVSLLWLTAFNSFAKIEFHPRLMVSEEYTDNLFLSETNEQEDWITRVEPGISLTYDSRSIDAVVDYSLRYVFYKENDDKNIDDVEDVQRANATVNFFAGRPFTIVASETITRETIDDRNASDEYNDLINRTTVYHLVIIPEYRLELTPSFSLLFGYTYDRKDYVGTAANDYEEHVGRFSAIKELSSNTSVSLNYAYTVHQDETNADFDQQDYTIGLSQQAGSRLSVTAEVGWSKVEYDNGFETDDSTWLLNASYGLSEALTLSAEYNQRFEASPTDGLTKSQSASVGLGHKKNELESNAEIYWETTDYVELTRQDDAFGTRFNLNVPLSVAFSSTFEFGYERASFDDLIDEDVDRYTFGTALNYEYRRLLASLGYRFRQNDSNVDDNDFINNVFTLSASVRF